MLFLDLLTPLLALAGIVYATVICRLMYNSKYKSLGILYLVLMVLSSAAILLAWIVST